MLRKMIFLPGQTLSFSRLVERTVLKTGMLRSMSLSPGGSNGALTQYYWHRYYKLYCGEARTKLTKRIKTR